MPLPAHDFDPVASSAVVADLETLYEALVFKGVKLSFEFKDYAVGALQHRLSRWPRTEDVREILFGVAPRLWRWLQLTLREDDPNIATKEELLPLPQPAVFPLSLQHVDFISDSLNDVKTQLQLIHAALDDLHTQGEQHKAKFCRLQEQLWRIPTCRCEAQEMRPDFRETPSVDKISSAKSAAPDTRRTVFPSESPVVQLKRLEVPMEVVKRPTEMQEYSAALLTRIVEVVDNRLSSSQGNKIEPHAPWTTQDLSSDSGEIMQDDGTNADQPRAANIVQVYQAIARDEH